MNEEVQARRFFRAMGIRTRAQLAEYLTKEAERLGLDQDVELDEIEVPELILPGDEELAHLLFSPGPGA